jgi:glycosyltransferase involved in cell wall biosynthesis
MNITHRVALAHDYLTQRGGAERVVLALVRAFPEAPLHTSLYDPSRTFPEFADVDVRTLAINRLAPLRQRHRLAFPLLAPSFSVLRIRAGVALCSSSGWAHAAHVEGRKVVYCHTPARWLYQTDRYLGDSGMLAVAAVTALRIPLKRWDRRAARTANRYLANSKWIAHAIEQTYEIEADVVHPPVTVDVDAPRQPVDRVDPGYVLSVSRFLPYKNVAAIVAAFVHLPDERLIVVGEGPEEAQLRAIAGTNVSFAGAVGDAELRWLYANARCLVAASYEDFGLTPLEAAAFGKPTVALRFGGFLDTIREGVTGAYFDQPEASEIAAALAEVLAERWNESDLRDHARSFSEERFAQRIREILGEEERAA